MAILIYSENSSVREKWFSALKDQWQVYQASTAKELFVLMKRLPIETLLVHLGAISTGGLQELCAQKGGCKIFALSDRPDDGEGLSCLQLGCVGYANTYIAPARLNSAIEAVESGLVWVGNSLMQYLIKGLAAGAGGHDVKEPDVQQAPAALANLSNREYEIAGLVTEGLQNSEIAQRMDISERTVKAHLSSIYTKTQTKGRLSLALLMRKG
ncbi:MAG: response regulator transcription factor [Desulforhopalus sp.]|nr:response regulator transcription factor [Desulforhopalus sp.]